MLLSMLFLLIITIHGIPWFKFISIFSINVDGLVKLFLLHLLHRVSRGVIVLLNVVILLINPLINELIREAVDISQGNDAQDHRCKGNLQDLFLEEFHDLGSSLVNDDTLGDASLGVLVLLEDWLEDVLGGAALVDSESSGDDLEEGEHEHVVGWQHEFHVLTVNIDVPNIHRVAHEHQLNGAADDVDDTEEEEDIAEHHLAIAPLPDLTLDDQWIECSIHLCTLLVSSGCDHSYLSWNWSWSRGDEWLRVIRGVLNTLLNRTIQSGV